MKRFAALFMLLTLLCGVSAKAEEPRAAALKQHFLQLADEVTVTEDSVIFTDAVSAQPMEIKKNPGRTAILYGSLVTLWVEAGGTADGIVGGSSAAELYDAVMGRDISRDAGVTVLAENSAGKSWSTESIVAFRPDVIICSTAMSGYKTIAGPAAAAGIPVIAVDYNDFADYLKWFKVFCHLNDRPDLWDSVAMSALEEVVSIICRTPDNGGPKVFSVFEGTGSSLSANTSATVIGAMIGQLGGVNIADGGGTNGVEHISIDLEAVYAADPDLIVIQGHGGAQTQNVYGGNAVWQALRAVKSGRVVDLDPSLFHNKPNSRFSEAYRTLAEMLYPEMDFD